MKHKLTLVLLSFFLGVQCMVAQQMKVTGVVINEDAEREDVHKGYLPLNFVCIIKK